MIYPSIPLKMPSWLLGIAALSLTACSPSNTPEPKNSVTWLTETPIGLTDNWKIANNPAQQGTWLAYYRDKSTLSLRPPQGAVQLLVDGDQGSAPSGLALDINSSNQAASMWRGKIPSKGLYLKIDEAAPIEIGVSGLDTEPLARFDVKADSQKGWHALWYGERFNSQNNSKYNIYYRHIDTQRQLSTTEYVMPGYYPQWIVSKEQDVAVFSWDSMQTPPKVTMRVRNPTNNVFSPNKVIATTTPSITPIFRAFQLGQRWFVVWVEQRGENHAEFMLRGVWSDDRGTNWSEFDIPSIRGFDIGDIQFAHDAMSSHALMTISGTWRFKDPKALNTFYVLHSADNGAHWSEPKIIRDSAANADSRANFAQVYFGDKPGSAWAVWEDWREVRGQLYFAYSEDYGQTWMHNNFPLASQPKGNNILAFDRANGYRDTQGQHIVAANVSSDAGVEKKLFSMPLTTASLKNSLAFAAKREQPNEKELKSRIANYWKALATSNYDDSYSYLDPFARAAWPVTTYKQRLGLIKYRETVNIDSIKVHGYFADVNLRVTAYVPEFEMKGKKHSAPDREVPITERWLWIDSNWFREYSEESSEIKFTRYQ